MVHYCSKIFLMPKFFLSSPFLSWYSLDHVNFVYLSFSIAVPFISMSKCGYCAVLSHIEHWVNSSSNPRLEIYQLCGLVLYGEYVIAYWKTESYPRKSSIWVKSRWKSRRFQQKNIRGISGKPIKLLERRLEQCNVIEEGLRQKGEET